MTRFLQPARPACDARPRAAGAAAQPVADWRGSIA